MVQTSRLYLSLALFALCVSFPLDADNAARRAGVYVRESVSAERNQFDERDKVFRGLHERRARLNLGSIAKLLSGQREDEGAIDPPPPEEPIGTPRALYILSNERDNWIISFGVKDDGTLTQGSSVPTGGRGLLISDEREQRPVGADYLLSQGSIAVVDDVLIAVNPGSNSLSVFNIDSKAPTKLSQVGGPIDSMGDTPVSVTISKTLQIACVANTGPRSGIACFALDAKVGLRPLDRTQRGITLNPRQSSYPVGPGNMISHLFFNDDSSALLAMVRGNTPTSKNLKPGNRGYISLFPVVNKLVSFQETRSTPRDIALVSGAVPIPGTKNILATDATFGAVVINMNHDNYATTLTRTDLDNQPSTSYATYSRFTKSVFVCDANHNSLAELDQKDADVIAVQDVPNKNPGMIGVVAAGRFVYGLSPGNATARPAIAVFDAKDGQKWARHIQNYEIGGTVTPSCEGLAVFKD
ncbi:MAG: hypothetical protein M1817_005123 [Caeruleum heppii]|nr:MAG: hypothetical protein M1817_005123 [Caeruleum heppii]